MGRTHFMDAALLAAGLTFAIFLVSKVVALVMF
jgi:hypothetical protein